MKGMFENSNIETTLMNQSEIFSYLRDTEITRDVDKIIVHCSDSDNPRHDSIDVIKEWHTVYNGWSDIGYQFFIDFHGIIYIGRSLNEVGAHTFTQNDDSIGICLSGKYRFSKKQKDALQFLLTSLCSKYGLIRANVYGHNEFDKMKTCPNFDLSDFTT